MKKQNGFTLIEVLITMAIFSIGILALTAMQISGMNSNQFARTLATASTLAGDKIEKIMLIGNDNTILDPGEHFDPPNTHNEGQIEYTLKWFVTDDVPAGGSKQIDITVLWSFNGKNKELKVTYFKSGRGAA